MDGELSELETALFEVFKKNPGQWLSRSQIAEHIGRKNGKLYPYDAQQLDNLVERGLIVSEYRVYRTVAKRWEYKLA